MVSGVSRRGRNGLARDRAGGNASDPQGDAGPEAMFTNTLALALGQAKLQARGRPGADKILPGAA